MARNRPNKSGERKSVILDSAKHVQENRSNPNALVDFNFSKIYPDFAFDKFSARHYEKFCEAIQKLSSQKWDDVYNTWKHSAVGSEHLDISRLKNPKLREHAYSFDKDKVLVLRYFEKRPMIGIRQGDTFVLLAIETEYDDVYIHDGKRNQNFR